MPLGLHMQLTDSRLVSANDAVEVLNALSGLIEDMTMAVGFVLSLPELLFEGGDVTGGGLGIRQGFRRGTELSGQSIHVSFSLSVRLHLMSIEASILMSCRLTGPRTLLSGSQFIRNLTDPLSGLEIKGLHLQVFT